MEPQTESATPVSPLEEGVLPRDAIVHIQGLPFMLSGETRVRGQVANLMAVGIPPAPPDTDLTCFEKARAKGERTFTLRAQDVTAPVLVRAWAVIQIHLGIDVANGFTVEAAVARLDDLIGRALVMPEGYDVAQLAAHPKIEQAMVMAQSMQQWPNRRVA